MQIRSYKLFPSDHKNNLKLETEINTHTKIKIIKTSSKKQKHKKESVNGTILTVLNFAKDNILGLPKQ